MNFFQRIKRFFSPKDVSLHVPGNPTYAQTLLEILPSIRKDMLDLLPHKASLCDSWQQNIENIGHLGQAYYNGSLQFRRDSPRCKTDNPALYHYYQTKGHLVHTLFYAFQKGLQNNRLTAEDATCLLAFRDPPPTHETTPPPRGPRPEPTEERPSKTDSSRYLDPFLNYGYAGSSHNPNDDFIVPAFVIIGYLLLVAVEDFPDDSGIQNIKNHMNALPKAMSDTVQTLINLLLTVANRFDHNTQDFRHWKKKLLALYLIDLLSTSQTLQAKVTVSGFLDYLKNHS